MEQSNNEQNEKGSTSQKISNGYKKVKTGYNKAKNAVDSYKAAGGLSGMAANAIDKKKEELKDKTKEKIKDMVPPSVKKKQQEAKAKADALRNKINAPKRKMDELKDKVGEAKAKINEKAFRKGVKMAANAVAPGTGEVADKALDTPLAKSALEKARAASNPISAVKDGTKELVNKLVVKQVKKKIIISMAPFLAMGVCFFLVLIVLGKFGDSQTFFAGDGDLFGLEAIEKDFGGESDNYKAFYENVEKYSKKYNADDAMIVSVLTSYTDNDFYTNIDDVSEDDDLDEDLSDDSTSIIEKTDKKYMKKKIKEIAKKIQSSGSIEKGDYNDTGSGSEFFWWLYDEFCEDYFEEYFSGNMSEAATKEKKEEIINFIYLYYDSIKSFKNTYSSCVSSGAAGDVRLTTYKGDHLGSSSVDYSKITTDANGLKFYEKDGKKYLIVATATNLCIDIGCGYVGPDSTVKNYTRYDYITYYDYGDVLSITFNNQTYDAMVLDSCGGCQWEKSVRGDTTDQRIDIWIEPSKYVNGTVPDYGSFSGGSCGIPADTIRLGNTGIYAQSIFPINSEISNIILTQGYRYDAGGEHGAIDLFCNRSNAGSQNVRSFCTSIPIIASHSGMVISVVNNSHCANSAYKNLDTTLPVTSTCGGNSVQIKIVDSTDPYYGYTFQYWHFDSVDPSITVGTTVQAGQHLGYMGSTGNSTGWHLHFAIKNASGQKLNQNDNILAFCSEYGLASDGIRATSEGAKN